MKFHPKADHRHYDLNGPIDNGGIMIIQYVKCPECGRLYNYSFWDNESSPELERRHIPASLRSSLGLYWCKGKLEEIYALTS